MRAHKAPLTQPRPVIDRSHISNHLTATHQLIETAVHIEIQQLQPRVRSAVVMMFYSAMTDARREVVIDGRDSGEKE